MRVWLMAICLFAIARTPAPADYALPDSFPASMPSVVDASVKEFTNEGYAKLDVHKVLKGTTVPDIIRGVNLSCTGGTPRTFGMKEGGRYIIFLKDDNLYEESSYFEVREEKGELKFKVHGGYKKWFGQAEWMKVADLVKMIETIVAKGDEEGEWSDGIGALKKYEEGANKGKADHLIKILDEKTVDAVVRESFPMFRFYTERIKNETCQSPCQGAHWDHVLAIRKNDGKVYKVFGGDETDLFKAEGIRFNDEENARKLVKVLIRTNHISAGIGGPPVEGYKIERKSSAEWAVYLGPNRTQPHMIIMLNEEGVLSDIRMSGIKSTKGGNILGR